MLITILRWTYSTIPVLQMRKLYISFSFSSGSFSSTYKKKAHHLILGEKNALDLPVPLSYHPVALLPSTVASLVSCLHSQIPLLPLCSDRWGQAFT